VLFWGWSGMVLCHEHGLSFCWQSCYVKWCIPLHVAERDYQGRESQWVQYLPFHTNHASFILLDFGRYEKDSSNAGQSVNNLRRIGWRFATKHPIAHEIPVSALAVGKLLRGLVLAETDRVGPVSKYSNSTHGYCRRCDYSSSQEQHRYLNHHLLQ
jgi:hypothetical protein